MVDSSDWSLTVDRFNFVHACYALADEHHTNNSDEGKPLSFAAC